MEKKEGGLAGLKMLTDFTSCFLGPMFLTFKAIIS